MEVKDVTVKNLYEYCRDNDVKMLSNYTGDFWEVYRNNYYYFDRLFCRSYKSFNIFSLNDSEDMDEVYARWTLDVAAFLIANNKRYSELWRLQEISDTDYSILDNYNVRETHEISTDSERTDVIGSRTDTKNGSMVFGSETSSENNSYVHGAKSEADSETLNYDTVVTNTETELNVGSQQNTSEEKVSADNVSTYSPKSYTDNDLGQRTDTTDVHEEVSAREDTKSGTHTEQSYTDSESKSHTKGQRTDTTSDTNIYGQHTDTHTTDEDVSKTVTRRGNIGVFSASKLLSEHKDLWEAFNFYKMIFDEIADEFLRIVY